MSHYEGTNTAPRTKDGKRELVFTSEESVNHDLNLRQALEGRIIFEILNLAQTNPEKVRKILERYPAFFLYDQEELPLHENPEGILDNISVPYVGLLKPTIDAQGEPKGESLVPPYAPVGYFFLPEEEDYFGTFNVLTRDSFNLGGKVGWEDKFTEELKREGLDRLIEIPKRYEKIHEKVWELKGDVFRIAKETGLVQHITDMALLYILHSRFIADSVLKGRNVFPFGGNFVNDGSEELKYYNIIHASPALTQQLANAGLALCNEYLTDIGKSP